MANERWDCDKGERVTDPMIDAFLAEVVEVCRKHGMSIGHEDHHGAFEVYRNFSQDAADWLSAAHIADER